MGIRLLRLRIAANRKAGQGIKVARRSPTDSSGETGRFETGSILDLGCAKVGPTVSQ